MNKDEADTKLAERLRASAIDRSMQDRLTPGAYARPPRQHIEWEASERLKEISAQNAAKDKRIKELEAGLMVFAIEAQAWPDHCWSGYKIGNCPTVSITIGDLRKARALVDNLNDTE